MARSTTNTTTVTTTITAPIDPTTHQPRLKAPSSREIVKAALKGRIGSSRKLYEQKKELGSPAHLTDPELIKFQHVVVGKLAGALIGSTFSSAGSILMPHFVVSATINILQIFHYQSKIKDIHTEAAKRKLKLDSFQALLPRILACVTVRIILLTAIVGIGEFTVLGDGTTLLEHLHDIAAAHFQSVTPDTLPTTPNPQAWQAAAQNFQSAYTGAHESVLQEIGHFVNSPSQVVNAPVEGLVDHLTDGAAVAGAVPTWGVADGFAGANALPLHTIGGDMVADGLAPSVQIGMAEAFAELNATTAAADVLAERIADRPTEKVAEHVDPRFKGLGKQRLVGQKA